MIIGSKKFQPHETNNLYNDSHAYVRGTAWLCTKYV